MTIIILSLVGVIVYRNSTKKKVDTDKDSIQEVSNDQNVNEESSKEDSSGSKDENKTYTKYPDDKDGDINVNNDYFELTCEKMSVTVDTSGNPAIVVTFKFVNRSDEPLSFMDAFDVKMSQKGSVCSSNVSFSEKPDNIDNKTKKINKGDSIECAFGFGLHDLFADVELTVFDKYLGFDEIGTTVVPIS